MTTDTTTTPARTRRKASRKSNGEGSVYQVASEGRWRASFYDVQGKRRTITRKTRRDADIALREALHARDAGTLGFIPGSIPTLGDWLDYWLERKKDTVRFKTHLYYAQSTRRVPPYLRRLKVNQLHPEHFEDLYNRLKNEQGLSNSTIRGMHGVLRQGLQLACRRGYLPSSPLEHVELPATERKEIVPLTLEETQRLLATARERGDEARWQLALLFGMRQGEVLGLRWQDIDFEANTIRVRHQLQRQGQAGLVLLPPKSRAGKRVLQLGDGVVAVLKEHRRRQVGARLGQGPAWVEGDFVFTTSIGTPVDSRNDARHWKSLLRVAGVRKVRLHDARHTAATLHLASGTHVRVLMELLGHSQISVTLNTYAHVAAPTMRAAAEALESTVLVHNAR